jgi:hypothetical protein
MVRFNSKLISRIIIWIRTFGIDSLFDWDFLFFKWERFFFRTTFFVFGVFLLVIRERIVLIDLFRSEHDFRRHDLIMPRFMVNG